MDFGLVGDNGVWLVDVFGTQELLSTRTTRSTLSVVIPLNVDGHVVLFGDPYLLWCFGDVGYRLINTNLFFAKETEQYQAWLIKSPTLYIDVLNVFFIVIIGIVFD